MVLSGIWFRKTGFPLKQCGNDKLGNATNLIAGVIMEGSLCIAGFWHWGIGVFLYLRTF
jgi:hypothetical protein